MSQFITLIRQALRERGQSHVVLDDEELLVCVCGEYTGNMGFSFTPCTPEGGEAQTEDWGALRCDSCDRILGRPDPADRRAVALRVLALAQEAGLRCAYVGTVGAAPAAVPVHTLLITLPVPVALVAGLKESLDLLVLDVPVPTDMAVYLRRGASRAEVFFAQALVE